jgi:hypothetical protein
LCAWQTYKGALERILHGNLHEFGDRLQARVVRQANDVVHIGALAVVDDALAAKTRV